MKDLIERLLLAGITTEYELEFDFSKRSTVGVGGVAEIVFYPKTIKEFIRLCDFFDDDGIEVLVLGNLSNVLPPDRRFTTPIILTRKLNTMEFSESVFVESGVTSGAFLEECFRYCKTGAEFLAGIPCSIGGAIYMNAGANGKYISDIVKKVLIYKQKRLRLLTNKECHFGYKKSVFMENDAIILGVEFGLEGSDKETISLIKERILGARRWLPKGKSMGCVFKNPLGDSAGRLIELAGLKGVREGGVIVSPIHANFMINEAGATQEDFLRLIERVKKEVFRQFGVLLEEEIRIIR